MEAGLNPRCDRKSLLFLSPASPQPWPLTGNGGNLLNPESVVAGSPPELSGCGSPDYPLPRPEAACERCSSSSQSPLRGGVSIRLENGDGKVARGYAALPGFSYPAIRHDRSRIPTAFTPHKPAQMFLGGSPRWHVRVT